MSWEWRTLADLEHEGGKVPRPRTCMACGSKTPEWWRFIGPLKSGAKHWPYTVSTHRRVILCPACVAGLHEADKRKAQEWPPRPDQLG